MVRRASLGRYDEDAVQALLERDPDPEAHLQAYGVSAARPLEAAKAEAWERFWRDRAIPAGPPVQDFARCFWRPVQHELMVPWAHRFLDEATALSTEGLLAIAGKVRLMMPTTCDQAWLERAQDLADADGVLPVVRTELLQAVDTLSRVLDARS